ncbi:hypothetical protein LTR37_007235 [Vermiconidia calcicola]|uniref:Uncharacterized protein n=1 Tax=Vermiconidia calcicola TaxID=1690605 RepID=A0ACC3NDZ9_9PEZI|nr:hypothetical protein LTR37_007235 [Vermiconidia calcicola]
MGPGHVFQQNPNVPGKQQRRAFVFRLHIVQLIFAVFHQQTEQSRAVQMSSPTSSSDHSSDVVEIAKGTYEANTSGDQADRSEPPRPSPDIQILSVTGPSNTNDDGAKSKAPPAFRLDNGSLYSPGPVNEHNDEAGQSERQSSQNPDPLSSNSSQSETAKLSVKIQTALTPIQLPNVDELLKMCIAEGAIGQEMDFAIALGRARDFIMADSRAKAGAGMMGKDLRAKWGQCEESEVELFKILPPWAQVNLLVDAWVDVYKVRGFQ